MARTNKKNCNDESDLMQNDAVSSGVTRHRAALVLSVFELR